MKLRKPKTQEQKDRETDARMLRIYGISLSDYGVLSEEKAGGCWICGTPPSNHRLHIDHDHKLRYLKIESAKNYDGTWRAGAVFGDSSYQFVLAEGKTKSQAVQAIRKQLKTKSVRGLLCARCNMGLEKFSDNPEKLRAAADYLEAYKAR